MERIDLHNYEAFFLDHLEGDLSEQGQAELSMFLSEHPDLQDELKEMGDISELTLVSSEASMNTEFLKADPTVLSALTVEDWMIEAVEGNLSAQQQLALDAYVSQNNLGATFLAYQKTVLKPDFNLSFGSTSELKRKDGFVIPFYAKWVAAAAIILLIANTVDFSSTEIVSTNNEIITADYNFDRKTKVDFQTRGLNYSEDDVVTNENPFEIIRDDENFVEFVVPNEMFVDTAVLFKQKDDPEYEIVKFVPDIDTMVIPDVDPKFTPEENQTIAVVEAPTKENEVVTEEPFKVITNRTGNLLNKDISFTRDRKKDSDEYVAYHFKIGRFEFDRKKSK